jgi:hypothetical protein
MWVTYSKCGFNYKVLRTLLCILYTLGPVYLSRLNLQQCVWDLGKAEPM